jgi:hypothetical protein
LDTDRGVALDLPGGLTVINARELDTDRSANVGWARIVLAINGKGEEAERKCEGGC